MAKGKDNGMGMDPKPAVKSAAKQLKPPTVLKHKAEEQEEQQLHHAEAPIGKIQRPA